MPKNRFLVQYIVEFILKDYYINRDRNFWLDVMS